MTVTFIVLILLGVYVLIAPDSATASIRGGAGKAIASGARSGAASIRSDISNAAKARSGRASVSRQARLDRWAGKAKDKDGNPIKAPRSGKALLALDRATGKDGQIYAGAKAVGRAGGAAAEAARSGWQEGREAARPGLAQPVQSGVDWIKEKVNPTASTDPASPNRDQPAAPVAAPKTTPPDQPAGTNGGTSTMAQTVTTEAGLLPAVEAIAAAAVALAEHADTIRLAATLREGLAFDPGSEVNQAIAALSESVPDPTAITNFAETAPALVKVVKAHATAVVGA